MDRWKTFGFTLIELMITVALCALVLTLTFVNVSFLNRGIVRSEAEKLYSACMYLQQCALTNNAQQELMFDREENKYTYAGRTETLHAPVEFGVMPHIKGPPSSPSHPIKSPITFNERKILFYPDGIISSGTVYLTDRKKQFLYALSSGIGSVSHLRVYRYTGKWELMS